MNRIFATAVLAAGFSMPTLAQGQEAPYADSLTDGGIVVTASRLSLDPRQIGSAVSIVTDADIKAGQIVFTKDILQDLAGIQITTDRPGDTTRVSIRGSDNDQLLWLIDGIRLGDPSSTSTQFTSSHMTSRDIARIEVLRGNQSSLYGSDAIGGVVNIITRRASEEGITFHSEGEAGSHGTVNGGASMLGKTGALDFRLTATGYSHDGPSLADPRTASPAGTATEEDGYWRYGFSGRAGLAATDTLSFQIIGFWQKASADSDSTTSDIGGTDIIRTREYAAAAQADYASSDGAFRADASVSRYGVRNLYFGSDNLDAGNLYRGRLDTASLNLSYAVGAILKISAGGNYIKEKADLLTADWMTGNPLPFAASASTKSAYGEIAVQPIDRLTLTGAARIDDNNRFGSFDTYRGTIAYVVNDALGANSVKFRASYGTGAKAPGLYQLFNPDYGNADLKPLKSHGGDFGFDMSFDGLDAQISYFFNKTRDDFGFDMNIWRYAQFGHTRQHGVEVALTLTPFSWMNIHQSFTYLEAREETEILDSSGSVTGRHYIDMGRPRHSGSTSVTLTPDERLSLTARARYRSRNASSYGGTTAAYAVVDLLASYGITDRIELYGRVTNLFDTYYQMSYGNNALGRAAYGGVRMSF